MAAACVMPACAHPGCEESAIAFCERCKGDTPFCADHGVEAYDRYDRGGPYRVWPDACWKCRPQEGGRD